MSCCYCASPDVGSGICKACHGKLWKEYDDAKRVVRRVRLEVKSLDAWAAEMRESGITPAVLALESCVERLDAILWPRNAARPR